jgi:hypothetical protein
VRVGDDAGHVQVARVYGGDNSRVVLLPDGQLGWPDGMVFTDEPFRPMAIEQLEASLLNGPYRDFRATTTGHYLVLYHGSERFAKASAHLLESLYNGLKTSLFEKGIEVHESEFPLVAVIFSTEAEFRKHKPIAPDVQAYYDILSNRIFFYETSERDMADPQIAARRKPQTVAHEGTHQILQNIGVHPRLAKWPLWLVEGLAEFCAPTSTKKGDWAGFSKVNPFHISTLADLRDPHAIHVQGADAQRLGRDPRTPMVEYIVTRTRFTPTDYALSWALTHYLANKQFSKFVAYLKAMSQMPPLKEVPPEEHLNAFRTAFGPNLNLVKMGKSIDYYLDNLKGYEPLPYYAVFLQHPERNGLIRRATLVSQSQAIINQWLEQMIGSMDPNSVQCQVFPFLTRSQATVAAEQWLHSR